CSVAFIARQPLQAMGQVRKSCLPMLRQQIESNTTAIKCRTGVSVSLYRQRDEDETSTYSRAQVRAAESPDIERLPSICLIWPPLCIRDSEPVQSVKRWECFLVVCRARGSSERRVVDGHRLTRLFRSTQCGKSKAATGTVLNY